MAESNNTILGFLEKSSDSRVHHPFNGRDDLVSSIRLMYSKNEEAYKRVISFAISKILDKLLFLEGIENNKKEKAKKKKSAVSLYRRKNDPRTLFNASSPPEISISDYLERIIKFSPCSAECFLVGCIYVDRVVQYGKVQLNALNIHRLLLTSIMLASKQLDDTTYNNKYYSHVGGIELKELNLMECKFLVLINHNLYVDMELFSFFRKQLELYIIRVFLDRPSSKPLQMILDPIPPGDDEIRCSMSLFPTSSIGSLCSASAILSSSLVSKRDKSNSSFLMKKPLRRSRSFDSALGNPF